MFAGDNVEWKGLQKPLFEVSKCFKGKEESAKDKSITYDRVLKYN